MDFDDLQHTGGQLISLVGDSEKPEVKKNMDDTETTLGEINEKVGDLFLSTLLEGQVLKET